MADNAPRQDRTGKEQREALVCPDYSAAVCRVPGTANGVHQTAQLMSGSYRRGECRVLVSCQQHQS